MSDESLGTKNILYIHHSAAIGGASFSLLYLIQNLDRKKYYPIVVMIEDGPMVDFFDKQGIETSFIKMNRIPHSTHVNMKFYSVFGVLSYFSKILFTFKKTKELIQHKNIKLVHLNEAGLISQAMAAKSLNIPVVWHVRSIIANGYLGIRKSFSKNVINKYADRVIAISHACADKLKRNPGKVEVIYNFVDLSRFEKDIDGTPFREEIGLEKEDVAVGILGKTAQVKGHEEFVQAALFCKEKYPNIRFILVGGKPYGRQNPSTLKERIKQKLKRDLHVHLISYVQKHRLDNVVFLELCYDIPRIIAGLDIVVMPSYSEPFGRPIIEAGGMAKPVIGSNCGGIAELIEDGRNGILVPPRNVQKLIEAILKLSGDKELRISMGLAGYRKVCNNFNLDLSKRVFELYDSLLI